eukprot:15455128-Alexandrium_andersonii.AAC.1
MPASRAPIAGFSRANTGLLARQLTVHIAAPPPGSASGAPAGAPRYHHRIQRVKRCRAHPSGASRINF